MAHGCSWRTTSVLQRQRPFFNGDEHGERDERLGHRRERHDLVKVSDRMDDLDLGRSGTGDAECCRTVGPTTGLGIEAFASGRHRRAEVVFTPTS
jgi:hypothetical protein